MITLEGLYDYWIEHRPAGSAIELTYAEFSDASGEYLDIAVIVYGYRNYVATVIRMDDKYTFIHELNENIDGIDDRIATCETYDEAINVILSYCYEASFRCVVRWNRIIDILKHDLEGYDDE